MLNSFVIALFPNTGLLQTFTIPLTACGDNERGISYFHRNETPESIKDLIQVLSMRQTATDLPSQGLTYSQEVKDSPTRHSEYVFILKSHYAKGPNIFITMFFSFFAQG